MEARSIRSGSLLYAGQFGIEEMRRALTINSFEVQLKLLHTLALLCLIGQVCTVRRCKARSWRASRLSSPVYTGRRQNRGVPPRCFWWTRLRHQRRHKRKHLPTRNDSILQFLGVPSDLSFDLYEYCEPWSVISKLTLGFLCYGRQTWGPAWSEFQSGLDPSLPWFLPFPRFPQ